MDIKTSYFETQKTARYSTYGNLTDKTKYFWFGLHGSKMQCEQVLYKFKDFDPDQHFVVAPEGMNRLYLDGFGGEVVASWMTKRDRLEEIKDFSNYLTGLYHKYVSQLAPDTKKIVLGFSQGGTSLFRWLHHTSIEVDEIIAYSCWIPEDIDLKESKTALANRKMLFTYGIQDQFLTEENMKKVQQVIDKNELSFTMEGYEGDHRISKDQLMKLFKNYLQ